MADRSVEEKVGGGLGKLLNVLGEHRGGRKN